jgi:putative transposase
MNQRQRRKFSNEFKAKVALEALRERESIESLSKKYDLPPNQIFQWKKIYRECGNQLFAREKPVGDEVNAKLIEEFYRSIGELKVANDFLKNNKIRISMDGKGRAIDNVFIERLWRSVKYEHSYLHVYQTGNELWGGLDSYFQFYNKDRLHQNLNYKTPCQYYSKAT